MMPCTGTIPMQALKNVNKAHLLCHVCISESECHGWIAFAWLPLFNLCCYETRCEWKPHQTSPKQEISVNVSLCSVSVLTDCILHFIMLNANFHTCGEKCFAGGSAKERLLGALKCASRKKGMSPAGSLLQRDF